MGWSGHSMIDPTEIEARFALEDGMSYMASIFTEPTEEDLVQIDAVTELMESLPPREADFVDLYYFKRKKQTEIAHIFSCSQPSVCYRLQRATSRIQFLLQLPQVTEADLLRDLEAFLSDPQDVQIMHLMWRTTCQSEAAKELGVSQGLVRHRFLRTIKRLRGFVRTADLEEDLEDLKSEYHAAVIPSDKMAVNSRMKDLRTQISNGRKHVRPELHSDPARYAVYVRLFDYIHANKNILRDVSRPSSEDTCDRMIDPFPV